MVGGLDIAALTAGDSTPGWEHRLRALRGRILVLSGDADAGRPLLRDALQALRVLGTEAPAEKDQLQRLLDGDADAGPGTVADAGTCKVASSQHDGDTQVTPPLGDVHGVVGTRKNVV